MKKMSLVLAALVSVSAFASEGKPERHHEGKSITRAEAMEHAEKHFDRLDANKDGVITPEERKDGHKKMHDRMREHREKKGDLKS